MSSLTSCTSTVWWLSGLFGEMKKPGRLTQFQFRGEARVRLHVMMCSLMEQIEIVVALDQRDEARQVAVLALAA